MITREKNMDLLRVVASIMVIALHIGAIYGKEINIDYPSYYFTIGNFYHSVTRSAVPIFIMLSGAFLLNDIKNLDYKYHYKKTFKKIVIPTLIFSVLYVIYSMCIGIISSIINGNIFNCFYPIKAWILGSPYYHMWYMYMIIGFYVVVPILIRVRLNIGEIKFEKLGWFCMILGIIIDIKSLNLIWPIQFIQYLGYFILGYSIKSKYKVKESSYILYLLYAIILLILIFVVTEVNIRYNFLLNKFYFLRPLSPIVIVSSICLYISFLNMKKLNIQISNIANHTFNIYLFHAGILDTINLLVKHILSKYPNPIWYIPLLTIIVFIMSYGASVILNKLLLSKKCKCQRIY